MAEAAELDRSGDPATGGTGSASRQQAWVAGPRTAGGKARSARNAWKHGLRARKVLVAGEEAARYAAFWERLFAQWGPRGDAEAMLVHRMAGAAWRLLRVPEMEAELLETLRDPEAPGGGLARAFLGPGAESAALARLTRYETALERSYLRSLRTLNLLRLARGVTGGPDVAGRDAAPEATATVWGETARPAKALPEPEPDWDGPGGWGSGGGGGRWDRASRYDDEPPEVVEVILDGGPDGGPVTRAEWDRLEAARHAADPGAAKGGEADNTGQTRSEADEFPNKLAPEPARGVPGRHRAAHTPPVRDWPGEPDYVPLPPEKRREPVSRVIAGPLSRFANGFER